MSIKKNIFGIIYSFFVAIVLYANWHDHIFSMNQPLAWGKVLIWLIFISFSGYTIYCNSKEHFFKSLKHILGFKWGIQIVTDLEIGLLFSLFIIYLLSGSPLTALLWVVPSIAFGNLAPLLYFAIHYDALVSMFIK